MMLDSSSKCTLVHISDYEVTYISVSPRLSGKWKSLNCVRLFATPWTIQYMGFSRAEY